MMKKKLFLAVMLITCASLIWAQSAQGVIQRISGEVEIKHPGASEFKAASEGENIPGNAIISTGFRSTAIIAVGSSVLTVRPLTRLSLSEIRTMENSENVNINLQAGRVRADVKPPSGTRTILTVQSPTATASVRGTIFETDGFNLNTMEGIVDVRGNSGAPTAPVAAGLSTYIDLENSPVDPFANTLSASAIKPIEGSQVIQRGTAPVKSELIITPKFE